MVDTACITADFKLQNKCVRLYRFIYCDQLKQDQSNNMDVMDIHHNIRIMSL